MEQKKTDNEPDPFKDAKDSLNIIKNSKTLRTVALILMWIFALIGLVFLIYFIKNVEFIKANPCGACENLGYFCTRMLTKT